jgi:hypothetical protein
MTDSIVDTEINKTISQRLTSSQSEQLTNPRSNEVIEQALMTQEDSLELAPESNIISNTNETVPERLNISPIPVSPGETPRPTSTDTEINQLTQTNLKAIGPPTEASLIPIEMEDIMELFRSGTLYADTKPPTPTSTQTTSILTINPNDTILEQLQSNLIKGSDETEATYQFRVKLTTELAKRTQSTDLATLIELGQLVSKKVYYGVSYAPSLETWISTNMRILQTS